ncbi:MAG: SDR family NAD(P)-dependent oxidoreductase [Actinomycetota bacterium]|nr:SDR family NAD(P)-dependent oxidoreductase [Actinomycetota bacterium]
MSSQKCILISGASTGIGEATALRFAGLGWDVWAGVRNADAAARLGQSSGIRPIDLDVTDDGSVAAAVATIAEARGDLGLDVLVNNAGVALGGPLEYIELDDWYRQFEVNFFGVVRLTKSALPLLRRAVDPRIIMVGSINSRLGAPLLGPYAASKHALAGLATSLRRELEPAGPLVTLLEPGAVKTEIWPKAVETARELESSLPAEALERYGDYIAAQHVYLNDGEHAGIDSAEVAGIIEDTVAARRPRARRLVGRDAQLGGSLARLLPDRVMEALGRLLHRRALRAGGR